MRYRTRLLSLILSIGAFLAISPTADARTPTCSPAIEIPLEGKSCDPPLKSLEISCRVQADVEGGLKQDNRNTIQRAADIFSWQAFLALNLPAGKDRGEPNPNVPINKPGPRVWQTWKEAFEIYSPDGAPPSPWNEEEPIPAACDKGDDDHRPSHLRRTLKVSDVVDGTLQALPADGTLAATLKDQQGRLLRYEIRLNQPLFEYISNSQLYNGEQQAKAKEVKFPFGSQLIKAAWRQVDKAEEPFFHVTNACVCDGVDDHGEPDNCRTMTMGLAGLHIMTKTRSAPQWIWSTFEQVDNVAAIHSEVSPLYNPACPPEQCPQNTQTRNFMPTQVQRVDQIPSRDPDCSRPEEAVNNVAKLNQEVQDALRGYDSVFQNYELVGTQWPALRADATPSMGTEFDVTPALLANTTMETFGQDTSSCMGCHAMARTLNPSRFVSADFSFTLNNALPRPKAVCDNVGGSESCNDSILESPKAPKTDWDRENWQAILDGFAATNRAFGLTQPSPIHSRLRCSSCHLNAGGNRDASWWVDMHKAYDYPKTTRLHDRINRCFERSMNGEAICNGRADCAKNPVMSSLTTYMEWLTRQFYDRYPDRQPCRGFPPFEAGGGDAARGERIYQQKCSFCHNADGEGRYENDTYFRPALWGSHSFNDCAGMHKVEKLGAFLRWNMPYTSGGMLTTLEANDLATFIDAQGRPPKKPCASNPPCAACECSEFTGVGANGKPCSANPDCAPCVCPEFEAMSQQ